jgi:hypothetical protein
MPVRRSQRLGRRLSTIDSNLTSGSLHEPYEFLSSVPDLCLIHAIGNAAPLKKAAALGDKLGVAEPQIMAAAGLFKFWGA